MVAAIGSVHLADEPAPLPRIPPARESRKVTGCDRARALQIKEPVQAKLGGLLLYFRMRV